MSLRSSATKSCGALALMWLGLPGLAAAQTVLNENFDDVITLGNVSNSGTPNVCLNSTCSNLTAGITVGSTANSNSGPAPVGANTAPDNANVRRGDNMINTTTGTGGFDGYFATAATNGFLVLGDDSNRINDGSPNIGTSFFRVPFVIAPGAQNATIGFDWAFDGIDTDAAANDTYTVRVIDAATSASIFTVLSGSSGSPGSGFGAGSALMLWTVANGFAAGAYQLEFLLAEAMSTTTQSAFGIDNIALSVTAVPLPPAAWLLFGGLATLGGLRFRSAHNKVTAA